MEVEVVVAVWAPAGGALVVVGAELVTVELVDSGPVVDCAPGTAELVCEVVEVVAAPDGVAPPGVVLAPAGVVVLRVVAVVDVVASVPVGLA